jgi:hypothetical protein
LKIIVSYGRNIGVGAIYSSAIEVQEVTECSHHASRVVDKFSR